MTEPIASPDTAEADRLYRGFPDFSAWESLSPTDADLWNRFASSLAERRKAATPEALKAAVEVAVRAAALDTGAIEGLYTTDRGFTMTVAVQGLAWEQMIEERGAGVRELFEAQLETYELVLDAVTQKFPITEAWIRTVHETICAPEKTYRVLTEVGWQEQDLPKGQYKTRPNHVRLTDGTYHAYAPVDRVPDEMHRLLEQIRTPEFEVAHPVLQASYIHYAFVVIHPFADGNGRVARALASVFFYRAESIPLVIFSNQRLGYLDSLAAADRGDYGEVISFFLDRGIDTMQLVGDSLATSLVAAPTLIAERLTKLFYPKKGFSREMLDSLAARLLSESQNYIKKAFNQLGLDKMVSIDALKAEDSRGPLPGYRRVMFMPKPAYVIRVATASTTAIAEFSARVLIAEDENPFCFLVEALGRPDNLEARLEDVHPELSSILDLRLTGWSQRITSHLLTELEKRTQEIMTGRG